MSRRIRLRVLPKVSDEDWQEAVAEQDRRRQRSTGRNGVKLIGDSKPPELWVQMVDALIERGYLDARDRKDALAAEWVKGVRCPSCTSSSFFMRRDRKDGRYVHNTVRYQCAHKCGAAILAALDIEQGTADVSEVPAAELLGAKPEASPDAPLYGDVVALLAGGLPDPIRPSVLRRSDGCCLFYAGQVNMVIGDPESGKTWLCLAAVAETLQAGRRAAYVDIDHNGLSGIVGHLLALGVPAETLADPGRFRHYEPEDGLGLLAVVADLRTWAPVVVVFDSIGELTALLGKSSNDADDWTVTNRLALQPLASLGACVLAVDHLAKNADSRRMGAGGTAAKRRSPGGAAVRVTVRERFAPGAGGAATLTINKDRHGGLRASSRDLGKGTAGEIKCGHFVLTDENGRLVWTITAEAPGATPGAWVVSDEDLAEVDALRPEDRRSVRRLRVALGWGSKRANAVLNVWKEINADDVDE